LSNQTFTAAFKTFSTVFRNTHFATYTFGNLITLIGSWMQRVAMGWLAWKMTQSPAWLGAMSFANLFPTVVVGPIAGVVADRVNRLWLTVICQALLLIQTMALFVLVLSKHASIGWLLGLTVIQGVLEAFCQPAKTAMLPDLVKKEDLVGAIVINSLALNMARFIGPALAGLIMATSYVASVFAINALTFVVFLIVLFQLRTLFQGESEQKAPPPSTLSGGVKDGLRYVFANPEIAALFGMITIVSTTARCYFELLPGFAGAVFIAKNGVTLSKTNVLAILTSSVGVGAIVGGIWMLGRDARKYTMRSITPSMLLFSVSVLVFVSSNRLLLAIPSLAVAGFMIVVGGSRSQAGLQMRVSATMRGRVMSFYGVVFRAGPALGAFLIGLVSEKIDQKTSLVVGSSLRFSLGLGAIISILYSFWVWKKYSKEPTIASGRHSIPPMPKAAKQ
jgi:MFS family permease